MRLRPQSLFGRTALTISLTLLVFMILFVSAAVYFVYIPFVQRYADDFAAVIVSAAHSLQSLPEEMHPELQEQLLQDHGLIVSRQDAELPETSADLSYRPFFRAARAYSNSSISFFLSTLRSRLPLSQVS